MKGYTFTSQAPRLVSQSHEGSGRIVSSELPLDTDRVNARSDHVGYTHLRLRVR